MSSAADIQSQIDRLEKEIRLVKLRSRYIGLLTLSLGTLLIIGWRGNSAQEEVRAKKLIVVDAAGKAKAVIAENAFWLNNESGEPFFYIANGPSGVVMSVERGSSKALTNVTGSNSTFSTEVKSLGRATMGSTTENKGGYFTAYKGSQMVGKLPNE